MKILFFLLFSPVFFSCATGPLFESTAKNVDLQRYMGKWYIVAARSTYQERKAYAPVETYVYDSQKKIIEVDFRYHKDRLKGPIDISPLEAKVSEEGNVAKWILTPLFPVRWPFPYTTLILAFDQKNYAWSAVGVPNQKYLWIMSRNPYMPPELLQKILDEVAALGYKVEGVKRMPQ